MYVSACVFCVKTKSQEVRCPPTGCSVAQRHKARSDVTRSRPQADPSEAGRPLCVRSNKAENFL